MSEKLYLLPNSVYCADATRSCNTSRWASTGLFFQASMRQRRNLANPDMAGESILIKNRKSEIEKRKYVKIKSRFFSLKTLLYTFDFIYFRFSFFVFRFQ